MTTRTDSALPGVSDSFARLETRLTTMLYLDGERIAYLIIFAIAVLTRFWNLGVRVMSHDESLHTRYALGLYQGNGFTHTPLMHGPLLFHAVAFSYLLFGVSDFTARIYPAVLGVAVVMIPIFLKRWLGKLGSLAASVLFLISPLILYYSRYIRHDIPAILAALVMVVAIWRYIEDREFKFLVVLGVAQSILYASKEVSFIYIAIFGSFLTLFFIARLLMVTWQREQLRTVFAASLIVALLAVAGIGLAKVIGPAAGGTDQSGGEAFTVQPADPNAALETGATGSTGAGGDPVKLVLIGIAGLAGVVAVGSVLVGQWENLRKFPELDVAIVMGTLILPMLTPFLIKVAGFDPMNTTNQGITRSILFTLPVMAASVLIGLGYFMKPPRSRWLAVEAPTPDEFPVDPIDGQELLGGEVGEVEVKPDWIDWITALFTSRWWAIGGPFWLIFAFFFTTMFTSGAGIGTGIIGSLGYWLAQQGVRRGSQPWYYYIMVLVPMYEFLPAILSMVAAGVGVVALFKRSSVRANVSQDEDGLEEGAAEPVRRRPAVSLEDRINFPVFLFLGYWIILNFVAYSLAGEKMPWLTTHLTTPMILLGGWVIGRTIERVRWRNLLKNNSWIAVLLIPVIAVAALRVTGPVCSAWRTNVLCNTIIPPNYQTGIFSGYEVSGLTTTASWLAAAVVLLAALLVFVKYSIHLRLGELVRLVGLAITCWMVVLTARQAWLATFINYDNAKEFLVYAHSSGAVKEVMNEVEQISLKLTDGYGVKVAYDSRVSWPFSWYLRDYYNAIYYADEASRGRIGDADIIIAGPPTFAQVESIVGDRYYRFDYIRMWWPMQDYWGYDKLPDMMSMLGNVLQDPELQRGLWQIFYARDYTAYANAVAKYRNGQVPDFSLSNWPVSDPMRVYIRKDVFAQVWDYGVNASQVAAAVDPYAAGVRNISPDVQLAVGQLNRPHGIALGPDGLLYVADSFNHQIVIMNTAGETVRTIGVFGLAPDNNALNEPWDVAVAPDGTIVVADTWNHRVVTFAPDGSYLNSWGAYGPNGQDPYSFWGPRGIAVDQQGNIYLADTGNKRILEFSEGGAFIQQIGEGGALNGQLDEPAGLAIGPDGSLYVADTWNQRIDVFSQDGLFLRQWQVDAWYAQAGQSNERPYIAVDEQGNVYISDPEGARIIVFDSQGHYLYSFGEPTTISLAGGLAVDSTNGWLYVADTDAGSIKRFPLPTDIGQPAQP